MVFEEAFNNRIGKKVIIIIQVVTLILRPLNILSFPSITFPVVDQGEYELDSVLLCFCHYKIQTLRDEGNKNQTSDHEIA